MSKAFFINHFVVRFAHCCKLSTCCCWTCNRHVRCKGVTLSYGAAVTVTLTAGLVKRCHLLEKTNVRTPECTPAHPTELLKDVAIVLLVPRIKLVLILSRQQPIGGCMLAEDCCILWILNLRAHLQHSWHTVRQYSLRRQQQ